jgi:hypothetical protein
MKGAVVGAALALAGCTTLGDDPLFVPPVDARAGVPADAGAPRDAAAIDAGAGDAGAPDAAAAGLAPR